MWIFVWFGLDGGHETCVVLLASPPGNMKTERILAISGHIKLSVEGRGRDGGKISSGAL